MLGAAEVTSRAGRDIDLAGFRNARAVLERQEAKYPIVQLQAVIGECLRERGRLGEAIEAYRSSIQLYKQLQMKSRVAYIQLLLAEALVAAGRDVEAATEIAEAIRAADEEGITAAVTAGVALLQGAVQHAASLQERDSRGRLEAIRRLLTTGRS